MYLVLVTDKDNKINGIRKWDQAFRMYTMIFCGANPHRSREIWQYVSIINTAAATYVWENVANYDITFRHLMEFNPQRSLACTYNQMWNLSMKDPISCSHDSYNAQRGFQGQKSQQTMGGAPSSSGGKRKAAVYCRHFNKGENCKYGKKCHFIERCSHCDQADHPVVNCPKLKKDYFPACNLTEINNLTF